jgi:hypothetical protein
MPRAAHLPNTMAVDLALRQTAPTLRSPPSSPVTADGSLVFTNVAGAGVLAIHGSAPESCRRLGAALLPRPRHT